MTFLQVRSCTHYKYRQERIKRIRHLTLGGYKLTSLSLSTWILWRVCILYLGDNVTIERRNWWRIKSRLCLKVQAWDGGRVMTMERSARCDKRWPHFLVVVLRMNPVYWYDWFYLTTWRNVSVIRKKIDGYGVGYCCVAHLGLATNHRVTFRWFYKANYLHLC